MPRPKDGTVIGTFSRSMAVAPLLADAPFDATKLDLARQHFLRRQRLHDVAHLADQDLRRHADQTLHHGRARQGADPDIFALMLRNVFGAKLKLVSGYPGTNDATLAMERGEVNGVCGISWSTAKARHMDWIKARQVNMPVQFGLRKEADIPDVPAVIDLVKGDGADQDGAGSSLPARPWRAPTRRRPAFRTIAGGR